jgi:hypothetical protein
MKSETRLNIIYSFSSHLTENLYALRYKSVHVVWESNSCLYEELYETRTYSLF